MLCKALYCLINGVRFNASVDDRSFLKFQTQNLLNQEFRGQIADLETSGKPSRMSLTVQKKTLTVALTGGQIAEFEAPFLLTKPAVYVDDPLFVEKDDRLSHCSSGNSVHGTHREALCQLLTDRKRGSLLDNLAASDNEVLLEKISAVCAKHLPFQGNGQKPLDIFSDSAGLQTFILIRKLLINGAFEENSTVIFDAPEIHLHPQLQVVLAEVLVLLQKDRHLHILLTTCSPYFLRALQVFTNAHGISTKCRYYHTGIENGSATVTDVTDSVDTIYKEMAEPFQALEDILFSENNGD